MKYLKRTLLLLPSFFIIFSCLFINNYIFAAWDIDVDYHIIPKITSKEISEIQKATEEIWRTWWSVMSTYKKKADELANSPAQQLNSWIMNRDTIMKYLVFVIKFLSQIWLVIWVGFIMYSGYKYMINVFTWNSIDKSMVPNAIIWVIIIIFSYAIMKTLTSIVWLS